MYLTKVICLYNYCFITLLEERRSLGRPRSRWKDNFKMDLQEVGWGGMNWIDLAQDRDNWRALVNGIINLQFS